MKTVAIISAAGGAGRTTLTAALAGLLVARKHPVVAVECDPANVLALHFGMRDPAQKGLQSHITSAPASREGTALQSDDGVLVWPWGGAGEDGLPDLRVQTAVAARLHAEPDWLRQQLAQLDLPSTHGFVLVDAASWPSAYAQQAVAAADLVMVVVQPDPMACATLPRLRAALQALGKATVYVANGVMPTRQFHIDVLSLMHYLLGEEMSTYRVHADAGIPEALARGDNFCLSAPSSQAAHDLQGLASWVVYWAAEQILQEQIHQEQQTEATG